MATEAGTANPELNALFAQLTEPFDPSEIKWRVTHTTRDGSRGAVIAFADPRAYSDRLNQIFTPSGWTRTYEVNTVSSVTRMKKDKLIQTGKVLVTCTVTIAGLGTHADSGEEWADEENAMTSAQAQAFKRACICFGLGRSSPRCGCHSTNIGTQSTYRPCRSGLFRGRARQRESPIRALPLCSGVQSTRKQRRGSKGSDAFSEIPSMGRFCGGCRGRGGRMQFPMHNFSRTPPTPWNAQRVVFAKRILFPRRSATRNLSRCWTSCRFGL